MLHFLEHKFSCFRGKNDKSKIFKKGLRELKKLVILKYFGKTTCFFLVCHFPLKM